MRKIYSLVLMATMLLVGTNLWAQANGKIKIVRTGVEYEHLQDAFTAALDGDVLELTDNMTDSETKAAWLGEVSSGSIDPNSPDYYANNDRSVTLDLKGHTYYNSGARYVIALTRGELRIKSTGGEGEIKLKKHGIIVYGTYLKIDAKTETPFSHLVIDENVKITEGEKSVVLADLHPGEVVRPSSTSTSNWNWDPEDTYPVDYRCDIFPNSQWGIANGARIDIYGKVESTEYACQVNGNVRSALEFLNLNDGSYITPYYYKYSSGAEKQIHFPLYWKKSDTELYLPGTTMDGKTEETVVGAWTTAKAYYDSNDNDDYNDYVLTLNDNNYAPYVHIHKSAVLKTNNPNEKSAVGFYSAGYSRVYIEGTCEGSTGLYVKSGDVELHDATITSNYEGDYAEPNPTSSSVDAGGSGIVIESNKGYTGNIDASVTGDTYVEGSTGYAIDEVVTNAPTTDVDIISIEGGTFVGGDEGTIKISEETAEANEQDPDDVQIIIAGGNITNGDATIGTDDLETFLNSQENDTHVTIVDGTMVVSQGGAPAEDPDNVGNTTWAYIASQSNAANPPSLAWTAQESDAEIASGTIYLGELQIISGDANHPQILTIHDGACLDVQHLIMNDYAQIIVKAGGKLIVEGTQGIVAKKDINIKLESSEAKQATFLFNPKVSSNKYPKATVDMTVAKGVDENGDVWTRFAIPVRHMPTTGWIKKNNATTWLYGWDYEANEGKGAWATVTNGSLTGSKAMKPWTGYTLSNNLQTAEVYTFKDSLVGNVNAELKFVHEGYNYFGNSYSSYIDAKTLLQGLTDSHVDGAIYMWSVANQAYTSTSLYALNKPDIDDWQKDVAPMQTFILQLRGADKATQSVNYDAAVWSNPRHGHNVVPANNAPRRHMAESNDDAYINMVVTAANGKSDRILFFENAANSDAYENGYDASKYMNENTINFYATVNGENLSNVVTDNLEGKLVTLQTNEDVTYTISFKTVEGNEYVLRDNVTGAEVAIFAGNTYEFAAQPNSVIEGRFEIVKAAKMPTAIENTEVKANVKGIYTLTGQYLGEDFSVLPAGVYVVNGVKIVK